MYYIYFTIVGNTGEYKTDFQGSEYEIITKPAIVPHAAIKDFPKKINSSPIEATIPNFAGFLITKKNPSFAAPQNPFPVMDI